MEIESRMRDSILLLGSEQIMKKKIEILSPAGSYDSLKAAIAAGADAVYVGGSRFGARAYANNLSEDQLLEAIDYVHLHGRKLYLTINTLLKLMPNDSLIINLKSSDILISCSCLHPNTFSKYQFSDRTMYFK